MSGEVKSRREFQKSATVTPAPNPQALFLRVRTTTAT
jgi:hypothetical protein